jgi:lipopolysaccharide/colanic/teichoic acid biosynthesis glycosyltransferase
MDVEYYLRASAVFDLCVIVRTAAAVLRGRGAF